MIVRPEEERDLKNMKTCIKCNKEQDYDQFFRLKRGEENRANICRSCHNARTRERYVPTGPHRTGWTEEGDGYIPLTQGQVAKVDPEDVAFLSQWNWIAAWSKHTRSYYAQRRDYSVHPAKTVRMHRLLLDLDDPSVEVDHRNHDTLDNRKSSNIRISTRQDNTRNRRLRSDSKHGLKGVGLEITSGKYTATISIDKKRVYLGSFDTKQEAHLCYVEKANEVYGDFAYREEPDNAL